MGNPNLTKILFAGLVITFTIATLFSNYLLFANLNNATINEPYASIFNNLSDQYESFQVVGGQVSDQG
jgi:hypothetical protein